MAHQTEMLRELNRIITALVQTARQDERLAGGSKLDPSFTLTMNSPGVMALIFSLQSILNNGLAQGVVEGKTFFWDFARNLEECIPGGGAIVKQLETQMVHVHSYTGIERAFLCKCLNEKELGDYLNALAWNTQLVASFYTFDSVLRSEEHSSLFLGLVDTLSSLNFNLPVDDERHNPQRSGLAAEKGFTALISGLTGNLSDISDNLIEKTHEISSTLSDSLKRRADGDDIEDVAAPSKQEDDEKARALDQHFRERFERQQEEEWNKAFREDADVVYHSGRVLKKTKKKKRRKRTKSKIEASEEERSSRGQSDGQLSALSDTGSSVAEEELQTAEVEEDLLSETDEYAASRESELETDTNARRFFSKAGDQSVLTESLLDDLIADVELRQKPRTENRRYPRTSSGHEVNLKKIVENQSDSPDPSPLSVHTNKTSSRVKSPTISKKEASSTTTTLPSRSPTSQRASSTPSTPSTPATPSTPSTPSTPADVKNTSFSTVSPQPSPAPTRVWASPSAACSTPTILVNEEEEDLTPVMLADASKPQHQRREQDDEEREIHDSELSENSKLELDDPPTAKPFSASGFDSTNSKENGDNKGSIREALALEKLAMLSPSASSASSRRDSPIPSTAQSLVPSSSADSDRFNRRVATVSMSFSTSPVGDGDHRLRQRSFDGSQLTFSSPSRIQEDADQKLQEIILEIKEKEPLTEFNNRCGECAAVLSTGVFTKARWCNYTGKWYCRNCHENKESVIPARILEEWNFTTYGYMFVRDFMRRESRQVSLSCTSNPHVVCTHCSYKVSNFAVRVIMKRIMNQPVLHFVELLYESPYDKSIDLRAIKRLRGQASLMKPYIITCRDKEPLIAMLRDRLHLMDDNDMYTLRDLLDIKNRTLLKYLHDIFQKWADHMKSCTMCLSKGHICEVCRNGKVIFAYQMALVRVCEACKGVFHKNCYAKPCCRCMRLGKKGAKT